MADLRSIPLVKAHALGNDFLLVPAQALRNVPDLPGLARQLCNRHRGIGADGLMIVEENPNGANTRLFNADGGEAEVSGNGIRCAAAWLARIRMLQAGATLVIGTVAGPRRLDLVSADRLRFTFRADMGAPSGLREAELDVHGQRVRAVVMGVGNPQCVVLGPATDERLRTIASGLSTHPFFPAGTNVELVDVEAPDRVRILIWERGVGPTEASGTGACASAVAAAFAGGANREIDVISPGGTQRVEWTAETIWLTGWAEVLATIDWWTPRT